MLEPTTYESWHREEQLAFWINTYNALTLTAVIDRYPIQPVLPESSLVPRNSIRQIPGVWDQLQFTVMGGLLTLDQVEHEILRKKFNEPRIHLALVCASKSCPPLRNEPFEAGKLDMQLDDQARRFFSAPRMFRVEPGRRRVLLSSIFKWYGEDFLETYQTENEFPEHSPVERAVLNFASRYVAAELRDHLATKHHQIEYLDYDWSLNEQEERNPSVLLLRPSTQLRLDRRPASASQIRAVRKARPSPQRVGLAAQPQRRK